MSIKPYQILLETCDPQMLDQIPPEFKDILQIDLEPIEGKEYDAAFVYEKVAKPITFKVKSGNLIFIPGEPETIKGFSSKFVRQFDKTMSFRQDINQIPNIPHTPCLTPWRVGLDEELERSGSPRQIRDVSLCRLRKIEKSRFMSMIVSNKTGTPLQRARIKLAQILANQFPGLVDIYGRGHNEIRDKAQALDPYMFSIGVENSHIPNYFTEKLTDCFITATVPLYYGCSNLQLYFNSAVIHIDIWDIEQTINQIIKLRENAQEEYLKRAESVVNAREDLFKKHSIIARIKRFCDKEVLGKTNYREVTLIPDEVGYFF